MLFLIPPNQCFMDNVSSRSCDHARVPGAHQEGRVTAAPVTPIAACVARNVQSFSSPLFQSFVWKIKCFVC